MKRLIAQSPVLKAITLVLVAATSVAGCFPVGMNAAGTRGSLSLYADIKLPPERIPWYFPDPKVPPPRFPEAHPDATYKEGMTPRQYFDHLCKLEAGEFISRTVKDVEGIYLLRPRFEPTMALLVQRHAMEDPFSVNAWDGLNYSVFHRAYTLSTLDRSADNEGRFVPERSYKFTEKLYLEQKDVFGYQSHYTNPLFDPLADRHEPLRSDNPYVGDEKLRRATDGRGRFLRYARNWPIEYKRAPSGRHYAQNGYLIERRVDTLTSRYGVAWRGIKRPRDRELGIGGGELYVIDLATNEIIAYRRGFVLGGKPGDGPVLWNSNAHCPPELPTSKGSARASNFFMRVLIPSTSLPSAE